jgi:hypothetical protein
MSVNKQVIFAAVLSMFCFSAYLFPVIAFAQSPSPTMQPAVSLPARMTSGPVPGAYIEGYVFDEDGKPVPNAIVSLWQDGRLWQPENYRLNNCINPQTTNIPYQVTAGYLMEGSYQYGYLYPGEYTLTVEKDGYKSKSVSVHVGEDTMKETMLSFRPPAIIINVTLSGYKVPTFTPQQLSYTGAITGTLRTTSGRYPPHANMSLWQDGRMVETLDNPQASFERNVSGMTIDYMFEHLAPGHYTVVAEYYTDDGYKDTVSVDVGTDIKVANILTEMIVPVPPSSWPSQAASPSTGPKPTPALPGLATLLVIGAVVHYLTNKK